MKITILEDVGSLKKGGEVLIKPSQINYFVGPNGSGKTVLLGALATHLKSKIPNPCWFAHPPSHILEKFAFEGFEKISKVYFFTGKTRQAQWIDMTYTLKTPGSAFSLHASEGRNAQIELISALKEFKDDPDSLVIFDEIDSNLDLKAKKIFWDQGLPQFKGTVVVVTHDPFFLFGKKVVDFSDLKEKSFEMYFEEQ